MANSVFFSDRNSGYQHLSESVYIGLCRHVGTSKQLIMRRQILDVRELIENQSKTHVLDDPRSISTPVEVIVRGSALLDLTGTSCTGSVTTRSFGGYLRSRITPRIVTFLSLQMTMRVLLGFLFSNFSHQLTGIKLRDLVSKSEMTFLFQVLSSEKSFAQL